MADLLSGYLVGWVDPESEDATAELRARRLQEILVVAGRLMAKKEKARLAKLAAETSARPRTGARRATVSDGLPGSKRAVAGSKTRGHAPARGRKQPAASCLSDSPVRPTLKRGCRIIAHKEGDQVHLWSRNGRDRSDDFVAIAEALRALPFSRVMLDGEAVAHCLDCRTFTSCSAPTARRRPASTPSISCGLKLRICVGWS